MSVLGDTSIDIPVWLKSLPLAPEYHPTLAEFQDPISFILKIEKEASSFGICKIVPPLPPPPKKTTLSNLTRSSSSPTFTTRQQQIGFCPRRPRPVQKPVWQSGEAYTLSQFETKARAFERNHLKKFNKSPLSPLETESLFWKACADRPFSVEYANDVPGSGFPPKRGTHHRPVSIGDSAWNMRGVSRAPGSLLRFMREDIAGVTSPMVYVAMMFSWFAWHAEDHELHSLNYLHMGAGKTWYGVPRDAAFAFEEVVRVHGYGGEVNPLVTFTILGEKTTVMSPEVFISAGIPCCRLVQNAGEFVVTFPGAYHSGFSHGFNCGEAANIATPQWLTVAKEAAIRRASINYPPMVSHLQLLYTLALSLCSRMPMTVGSEPRSSRLKDKMKGEGEVMIKDIFVQNVIETNGLLNILHDKGSSCVVLPQNTSDSPLCLNSLGRSHLKIKPRLSLGLCSREEALEASRNFPSNDVMLGRNAEIDHLSVVSSPNESSLDVYEGKRPISVAKAGTAANNCSTSDSHHSENEKETTVHVDGLLDQGLLSCVTCGILSFTCVAVVHPRETAARYLMSAGYGFLNDQNVGSGELIDKDNETNWKRNIDDLVSESGQLENHIQDRVDDNEIHCSSYSVQISSHRAEVGYHAATEKGMSALALLASAYGDSSDSEEEGLPQIYASTDEDFPDREPRSPIKELLDEDGLFTENSHSIVSYDELNRLRSVASKDRHKMKLESSDGNQPESTKRLLLNQLEDNEEMETSSSSNKSMGEPKNIDCTELENCHAAVDVSIHQSDANLGSIASGSAGHFRQLDTSWVPAAPPGYATKTAQSTHFDAFGNNSTIYVDRPDKDSSRMHVFCLEHALEVEKLLHPIGGVDIMLLSHPDYPKIEAEAKSLAEELGNDYIWKDIDFREATENDQERIRAALEDEECIPTNSDWAVKMGINLYYSASLSKSPLYSKQMPYNAVIYKAFGCSSPNNSPVKQKPTRRKTGRQKKIVVSGKWCGKVWMSNQVHPYLVYRTDAQERELSGKLPTQVTPEKKPKRAEIESSHETVQRTKLQKGGSVARKSEKKRKKKPLVVPSIKKLRCTPQVLEDSLINSEDAAEVSPARCGMVLRSCRKVKVKDDSEEGPSTRLRRRRSSKAEETKIKSTITKKEPMKKKARTAKVSPDTEVKSEEAEEFTCDIEGCSMSFRTKQDLMLHKKDICPEEGCGKKFFSHKYLVQHRKVHMDDRPLECPWKGCSMRFKWAWARTEHIRVHTGDRPYVCRECGQTFRFVSDFSRHKRKTGHVVKKSKR